MGKRLTLPQQRSQETRQRILGAARRVFARQGFSEGTVDRIAAEAGVSMGALYHHFSGKEELFRDVLAEHIEAGRIELGALRGATSFRDAIERFVRFWVDHLTHDDDLDGFFLEFWAQAAREPWAQEAMAGFFREARAMVADGLRAAQDAGFVRDDLDVETAALLVLAAMEGVAVFRAIDPAAVDFERITRPWVDLIERFIAGPGGDIRVLREKFADLLGPGRAASPSPPAEGVPGGEAPVQPAVGVSPGGDP